MWLVAVLTMNLLVSFSVSGQIEFPEDKVHWKFSIQQDGENATIIGEVTLEEGWHIYAANLPDGVFILPSTVDLEKSSNYKTIGGVIEPKPIFEHDELADEDLYYHSHKVVFKRKIKITSEKNFTLKGSFGFQTCDDTHCLPPFSTEFTVKVKGVKKEVEEPLEDDKIDFAEVNGDEAKDKDGNNYILVDGEWLMVPKGNTVKFYKKFIELGGNHEK